MEFPLGHHLRDLSGPVLLTGHTGFKGTWLTFLLEYLEVPVIGYSLEAEKESLFDRGNRTGAISEVFADIRDYQKLENFINAQKPSTIIHMAAQPLVLKSYEKPQETFDINVMGTINVLDVAFKKDFIKAIIVVSTDKVYRNDNSGHAFVETDPLEGKDPYSASKVGTEAVVAAWQQIKQISGGPKIASVRSGNVLGGGDFAENRIIPDFIRAVIQNKSVEIRNPNSIRPWQHVLEPLIGYLKTLEGLLGEKKFSTINFGPEASTLKVQEIINAGVEVFPEINVITMNLEEKDLKMETEVLQLNSNFAKNNLNWKPKWTTAEALDKTFEWWRKFLVNNIDPRELCMADITSYLGMKDKR
jgi:CDP-glucose 4,6-dehydratase